MSTLAVGKLEEFLQMRSGEWQYRAGHAPLDLAQCFSPTAQTVGVCPARP